jgi:hypothetical protein
MKKDEID